MLVLRMVGLVGRMVCKTEGRLRFEECDGSGGLVNCRLVHWVRCKVGSRW